jgi:BirA family biotin operon repressor/biotin-[acetyl-CoA-carboxylase] ligase
MKGTTKQELQKIGNFTLKHTSFDLIDSTQIYARSQLNELKPNEWNLYTANGQTGGIGQHNRVWVSPYGVNVYATYAFLLDEKDIAKVFCMPQVSAFSVANILTSEGINCSIKWVNDVLINSKKVCGVLAESFSNTLENKDSSYAAVLIGIGINVNSEAEHLSQVSQPATSMKIETSKKFDVGSIIASLSNALIYNISKLISEGFSVFGVQIKEKLEYFGGKPIVLKQTNKDGVSNYKVGYIKGIGDKGELTLANKEGFETFINGCIARGSELKEALSDTDVLGQLKDLSTDLIGVDINAEYSY